MIHYFVIYILYFSICLSNWYEDKNYVFNGSFELEFNITQNNKNKNWCFLEDYDEIEWYQRFSNQCSNTIYCDSVPSNSVGFQTAQDGNSYAGIGVYDPDSEFREYLVGSLSEPLVKGQKYKLSYFVNQANCSRYGINSFGATLLSEKEVIKNSHRRYISLNHLTPLVEKTFNSSIDTINWFKVEGSFTAIGGEEKIIIGCFKKDSELNIKRNKIKDCRKKDETIRIASYYLIDNVSVIRIY